MSCSVEALPGGYTVSESAMNREWLEDRRGELVTPGVIQRLYTSEHLILLVAFAASADGVPVLPQPIDSGCLVALLIDPDRGTVKQVTMSQADALASRMTEKIKRSRSC